MRIAGLMLVKADSKRLPGKNTLDFLGKPMFVINLEKCLKIFNKVYVSSENLEILETALKLGAIPIKRPKELCGDTPNIPVYQHAMKEMDCDAFVAVQANSPTVEEDLIRTCNKLIGGECKEIMTTHADGRIYGSIWAMTKERLEHYDDPYNPRPDTLLWDDSTDIHTIEDYNYALNHYTKLQ